MKSLNIYSKILRNAWFIEKSEAEAYLPAVMQLVSGQQVQMYDDDDSKDYTPYALSPFDVKRYNNYADAPDGSVAIISVEDVLMKDDYCGVPGTKSLTQRLEEALAQDNIIGAVLVFDTPGGSTIGPESFARAIVDSEKPVVGFVEGRAASAGYWIASACDEIIISGSTSGVGSIGTYATIKDYTKYYEEMGIKVWEIYATESTDKNKGVRALIENSDPSILRQNDLDPLNKAFTQFVNDQRDHRIDLSKENVLTGKMYRGQEAIDSGLADSMGTLVDALQRVEDLSIQSNQYSNSNHMFNSKTKMKSFMAIVEKSSKGEAISAEELSAANEELEEAGVDQVQLVTSQMVSFDSKRMKSMSTSIKSAVTLLSPDTPEDEAESFDMKGAIETLQSQITSLTEERDTLKSELSNSSDTPPTPPKQGQQDFGDDEEEENEFTSSVDKELAEMQSKFKK